MLIEPTITWVPLGFSGYIWLDTKIVLKSVNDSMGQYLWVVYISTEPRESSTIKGD